MSLTPYLLVSSLKKLGVPVVGTEQVPEKLGSTVEEIDRLLDYKFSKNTFDAFRDEEIIGGACLKSLRSSSF